MDNLLAERQRVLEAAKAAARADAMARAEAAMMADRQARGSGQSNVESDIKIHGPDGSTFSFPAGTPRDTIEGAMKSHYSGGDNSQAQPGRRAPVDLFANRPPVDLLANASGQQEPSYGGKAMNATAGANDALYSILGAPVDLARGAMNFGIGGVNAVTGADIGAIPSDSFGGSQSIAGMMGAVHPALDPQNTVAATTGERIARGIGEGAGYALAPEAALAGLTRAGAVAPRVGEAAAKILGPGESAASVATNAAVGGAAGGGSVVGMDMAQDRWKPVAGLAGGLVGGGLGALATGLPGLGRATANVTRDFVAPMREAGREQMAGRQLLDSASNPAALRQSLADGAKELVPGSRPTTFQASGDMGIGALERGAAAKRPEQFNGRRADQNAARLDAMGAVQAVGNPETVAAALRQRLDQIDARTQKAFYDSAGAARESADALGRGVSPESAGSSVRASLESARAKAKEQERALWTAVDPDGTLSLSAGKTRQAAAQIVQDQPKSARPFGSEETAIHGVLSQYGDVVPFSEMTALSSRVKSEMRAERFANGETPAYRRLSQLNGAIQSDLETAVAGKVQQEAQAVARGEMSFADTVAAKLSGERDNWLGGRQALAGNSGGRNGGVGYGASGSAPVFGLRGTTSESPRGFRPASSNQGLASAEPNFDAAALGRLNAARGATRERVATFDNKTLGPIRRRPSTVSPYDMPASAVPQRIFAPGPKGFEAVQTFRKAVGDQDALNALQGYAIDRLRSTALREDGTFDPAKLAAWRRNHTDALRAFPALDAKLADAGTASEAMSTVAASRKQALDEAQKGKIGALIGVDDPQDVTRVVGSIFGRQDSARQMGALRSAIRGNAEAATGLRKSIADYIAGRFVGNTEAGTSGQGTIKADQFQTFIRQNASTLKAAGFGDGEIATMQAIADDLQRANRSIASVKLPGGSNTAQDTLAVNGGDNAPTLLAKLLLGATTTGSGAVGGFAIGGGFGAVAGAIGGQLVSALRMNGIQQIDELVADALLNPERARLLIEAVKPENAAKAAATLAQRYRRAALATMAVTARAQIAAALADGQSKDRLASAVPSGANRVAAAMMRPGVSGERTPMPSSTTTVAKAMMARGVGAGR